MESMILVLTPKECADLLNGDLSILVRKKFPKDYVGWFCVYCTKDNNNLLHKNCVDIWWVEGKDFQKKNKRLGIKQQPIYNGKVIARVWCDKVEEIIGKETKEKNRYSFGTETLQIDELEKMSRLNIQELCKYIGTGTRWQYGEYGKAIRITKVEPFSKPKEIKEFKRYINDSDCKKCAYGSRCPLYPCDKIPLTHAPTTYCYIEVDA